MSVCALETVHRSPLLCSPIKGGTVGAPGADTSVVTAWATAPIISVFGWTQEDTWDGSSSRDLFLYMCLV
jgi:hypothetical protein